MFISPWSSFSITVIIWPWESVSSAQPNIKQRNREAFSVKFGCFPEANIYYKISLCIFNKDHMMLLILYYIWFSKAWQEYSIVTEILQSSCSIRKKKESLMRKKGRFSLWKCNGVPNHFYPSLPPIERITLLFSKFLCM